MCKPAGGQMAQTVPSNSEVSIEMRSVGTRSDTNEALRDPKRVIKGLNFSKNFPFLLLQRDQVVPRYLNDKISHLPDIADKASRKHRRRLDQFHLKLASNPDSRCLLNRNVWVTGLDGFTCKYHNSDAQSKYSIAQNLDIFQQGLADYLDRKLTLCAINIASNDEFEIFMPSYQRAPARFLDLLKIIFSDRWSDSDQKISEYMLQMQNVLQMQKNPVSQLGWQPQLPSRISVAEPPLTDPSHCDLDIMLEWVHEYPKFEPDWSIYVSEPHTQRPRVDALRFVALTAQGAADCRLMLFATSGEALERCKLGQDIAVHAKTLDRSMGIEKQVFESLLVSVEFIISEVSQYVAETLRVTQELDMASRRNPSVSKVQFLMHLLECHQWAAKSCDRNVHVISKVFVSPLPVQQHVHRSQRYVDDLRYLASELTLHAQEMEKLKEAIVAQIDLFDKRRNRNIGMFIAIYVPLAFSTVR